MLMLAETFSNVVKKDRKYGQTVMGHDTLEILNVTHLCGYSILTI